MRGKAKSAGELDRGGARPNIPSRTELAAVFARPLARYDEAVARARGGEPREICAKWVESYRNLREFEVAYDPEAGVLWTYFDPKDRPSITPDLAREGKEIQQAVKAQFGQLPETAAPPIRFLVVGSRTPGIFSMGGDLRLITRLVRGQERDGLIDYATACIDLVHANAVGLDLPIVTISLVQGDALGGGFEAAMSSHFVVAEKSAKFGLPEVLFNLFPGMGGYSLIARRIGAAQAERMMLSGRIYSAEQLYDMGLVDLLAEDGEGEQAVTDFIARHNRRHGALHSVVRVRSRVYPLTYEELYDIAMMWVDTAMSLDESDLNRMERLAKAQDRRGDAARARS